MQVVWGSEFSSVAILPVPHVDVTVCRLVYNEYRSLCNPHRNILDGQLLWRFLHLGFVERNDLAKRIGTSPDQVSGTSPHASPDQVSGTSPHASPDQVSGTSPHASPDQLSGTSSPGTQWSASDNISLLVRALLYRYFNCQTIMVNTTFSVADYRRLFRYWSPDSQFLD